MDGLIFIFLALFPFGKLLGPTIDLIVIAICALALLTGIKFKPNNLIIILAFSLIFSLSFFNLPQIFLGAVYLVRLISYIFFAKIIFARYEKNKHLKEVLLKSLILIGVFIALLGYLQYFFLPDLRTLKTIGWDDHYYRLASTFLDPAFTGIILILAEILLLVKTLKSRSYVFIFLNLFFLGAILLTYSRASFLALFFAFIFLFLKFKQKIILLLLGLFLLLVPFLPQAPSEGTNLLRTYSIGQKSRNFSESFQLIKISPVFGLGFDNLCIAKTKFLGKDNPASHTCSGLDNSLLFIIAATGIVGLLIFAEFIIKIIAATKLDIWGWALLASLLAVFIHGMFTATWFYNFVLGWLAVLIGVTRKITD